jgi:hypothetical protein
MRPRDARRGIEEGQHQSLTMGGEEDRVVLIEWLNAAVGTKSYRRVSKLIGDICALDVALDAATRDSVYIHVGRREDGIPPEKLRRRREVSKLLRTLDRPFTKYVFHPRLTCVLHDRRRWWFDLLGEPVPGDYKLTRANGRRIYEADAVFGIFRLASYGFLSRVRQCLTCQKWLYAHPSHKKFCNSVCQLKHFATTPRQKEKRAAYMRDYRTKEKQESETALRLARESSHLTRLARHRRGPPTVER